MPLPEYPVPAPSPKAAYGHVHLHYVANLWDLLATRITRGPIHSTYPLTFEDLGQAHGYILYCTQLQGHFPDPALLEMKGLADRAYIYIDTVSRTSCNKNLGIMNQNVLSRNLLEYYLEVDHSFLFLFKLPITRNCVPW